MPESIEYLFQFQYGAIKSLPSIVEVPNTVEFQFQYGAIKRDYSFFFKTTKKLISIPVWCD